MNRNQNPYQQPNRYQQPAYQDDYQQPAYQNTGGYEQQPAYQDDYQQPAYQNTGGYEQQPAYQDDYQQPAYQNTGGYEQQPAYQDDYQQPAYQNTGGYEQQPAYQDDYQQPAYQDDYQQPAYQDDYQQPAYQQPASYETPDTYQPQVTPQTSTAPRRRAAQRVWSTEPVQPVPPTYDEQPSATPSPSDNTPPPTPSPTYDTPQTPTAPQRKEPAEIVISAKNIHKTFGKGETAQVILDGADLDIEKGSFVSLMGESGTGKSTLLYLIGGLDRDFTGDILVSGKNIANLSDGELSEIRCKQMGFVFQFYNLAANLTVEDNILLPLEISGRKISEYREKYQEILEITGLESKVKSYPSQLSGGQQQRVAIARAVLGDPEIILADEPTGNLDAASGAEIMELFARLNKERGVTILQVTHSAEAASYSSRIVTLKNRVITG